MKTIINGYLTTINSIINPINNISVPKTIKRLVITSLPTSGLAIRSKTPAMKSDITNQ